MSKSKKLLSLLLSTTMVASCMSSLALTGHAAVTEYANLSFSETGYAEGTVIKQDKTPTDTTIGDIKYSVGGRGSGGGDAGFYVKSENENQYLQAAAGRWSSDGRNAYLTLNNVPESLTDNYALSFKVRFPSAASNFKLKQEDGTLISNITPADIGAELNTWYGYSYIVQNGTSYQFVSLNDEPVLATTSSSNAIPSRIDFVDTDNSLTIDIDDLFVYSNTDNICLTTSFMVSDAAGEPLSGAKIEIGKLAYTTDSNGFADVTLPEGTYECTASKFGYLSYSDVLEVSSDGIFEIYLEENEANSPVSITVNDGQTLMHMPVSGQTAASAAFTAAVYNSLGQQFTDEGVTWSIDNAPAGVSIDENGVVTVTDAFVTTEDGVELTIRATSVSTPDVSGTTTLVIDAAPVLTSFEISGKTNVKNGTSTDYSVINAKDQYGDAFVTDAEPTFSSDNSAVTFNKTTATVNFETVSEISEVKITAQIGSVTAEKTIKVHDYYFYESGIKENDHNLRMNTIGEENVVVMPAAASATATSTITFDEPLTFEPNTLKEIAFDQAWTVQGVTSQYRRISFAQGNTLAFDALNYIGTDMGIGANRIGSGSSAYYELITPIGSLGAEAAWTTVNVVFKTNADSKTTATVSLSSADGKLIGSANVDIAEGVTQIDNIQLAQEKGAPDNRLLGLKNIIARDSNNTGVVIDGPDHITKIYGTDRTVQYSYINVSPINDNEFFIWELAEEIDGVTLDDVDGILTVSDSVAPGTIIKLSVISLDDPDGMKTDSIDIIVNDYAGIKDFTLNGPTVMSTTGTAKLTVSNIVDEYGDVVDMTPTYEITSGSNLASVSADGTITAGAEAGTFTVTAKVGNPGKELAKSLNITTGSYYYINENLGGAASVDVPVAGLIGNSSVSEYKVSLLKNGEVAESTMTAVNGVVTVNTAGAQKLEVSPIFKLNLTNAEMNGYYKVSNVYSGANGVGWANAVPNASASGSVIDGLTVALADGFYKVTIKKTGGRSDFLINGKMIGNNVDQDGYGRTLTHMPYEIDDVRVVGGIATFTTDDMRNNGNIVTYVELEKKADFASRKRHIFIGGDSTVATYYDTNDAVDKNTVPYDPASNKRTGWGQVFGNFLNDDVVLVNMAASGDWAENWRATAFPGVLNMAQPGDYLLVQFGINDRGKSSGTGDTAQAESMRIALEDIVNQCYENGIIPILINPMQHEKQWGDGDIPTGSGHGKFFATVMTAAENTGALHVNLSSLTADVLGAWGREYTRANYHTYESATTLDNLHLSYQGATTCAALIAGSIYDQQKAGTTDAQGNTLDGIGVNTAYSYSFIDSNGAEVTISYDGITTGAPTKLKVGTVELTDTTASVAVENITETPLSASLIIATYDANGNVVNVVMADKAFNAGTSDTLSVNIPSDGHSSVKAFVWDTVSSMKPLK